MNAQKVQPSIDDLIVCIVKLDCSRVGFSPKVFLGFLVNERRSWNGPKRCTCGEVSNARSGNTDGKGCFACKVGEKVEIWQSVGVGAKVKSGNVNAVRLRKRFSGEKTVGHNELLFVFGCDLGLGRC